MNIMYFLYLGIVILAFLFSIYFITNSSEYPASQVGIGPIIQLLFAVPIFLISCLLFYFLGNSENPFLSNFHLLFVPLILELGYLGITKQLNGFFKKEAGNFLIRCSVYSMIVATFIMMVINYFVE